MCRGPSKRTRMIIDPLQSLPELARPTKVVELDCHCKSASKRDNGSSSVEPWGERQGLKLKLPDKKFEERPKLERSETRFSDEKSLDIITFRRSKSLLSKRSDRGSQGTKSQAYKAINVKAIGRNSEAFAQCINIKEDKRLLQRLTCLDREKTVFRNSITRDEKVLLQRSRALANVLSKRELYRERSGKETARSRKETERSRKETDRSRESGDKSLLYGVKLARCVNSREEGFERSDGRCEYFKAKENWANTVSSIMQRDIKTWHKNYLRSTKQRTHLTPPPPQQQQQQQRSPPPLTIRSESSIGTLPLKRYLVESQKMVDKGDWITNYINTSCAEYLPTL